MSIISKLKKQIHEMHDQILQIQKECSHPRACVTGYYGCDVGNFDESDDDYYIDLECSLCENRWHISQSKDPDGYEEASIKYDIKRRQ